MNQNRLHALCLRTWAAWLSLALLCGCSTPLASSKKSGVSFLRKIDYSQAPELKELTGQAQELAQEMYPKICALLLDEKTKPPARFELVFQPLKSLNTGEAHLFSKRIYINSEYLTNKAERSEHFSKVFTHEMTHMAIHYKSWPLSVWKPNVPADAYWGESIANYAFYKLIGVDGWMCPACNIRYPHYTSGYTCGGAFLLDLENRYGTNIVRRLAASLRKREYTDNFFLKTTGKSLEALWGEFQNTPAYQPGAAEAQELRLALGYTLGGPPKDVLERFARMVDQNANDFVKKAIKSVKPEESGRLEIQTLMTLYLYLIQPGGSSEQYLLKLRDRGELPGIGKGDKSWVSKTLNFEEMETRRFPVTQTLQCGKAGDSAKYHYRLSRASQESGWKLENAWKSAADGSERQELPIP